MRRLAAPTLLALALAACGAGTGGSDDDDTATDAAATDVAIIDAQVIDAQIIDAQVIDAQVIDAQVIDAQVIDAQVIDAQVIDAQVIDAAVGPITGGPCSSGAPGATAYRIRWANGGGTAYVVYEVHAMPDTSRFRAGAYGYTIPFTPQYVDTALAQGGLLLDSSSFVDIQLSTVGISSIGRAHLAIYGRSYNTTASGSFHWQTFEGTGAAPNNVVANSAPYEWYAADMTTELSPGNDGVLIRIKAGPSSGSLAVNRIEICLQAT
ncbi:MAG: hypothetical protein F9K40_09170 [Kofleriaceae bacterium]|nr:MAG: hypothetical protein F9K40_09170 [Kofleriaceae bacterium]